MAELAALLDTLRARGVQLEVAGDRLRYRPRGAVPPDLRARLLAHKAELLAALAGAPPRPAQEPGPAAGRPSPAPAGRPRSWYAGPWPDHLAGLGPRSVGPFDLCADCGAGSWVRYGPSMLCAPCAGRRGLGEGARP